MKKPILIVSILLTASISFTSDKQVEDLLSKMRGAYSATQSAQFTVKVTAGQNALTAECLYQSPFKFRMDVTTPKNGKVSIVSDGKELGLIAGGKTRSQKVSGDNLGSFISPLNLEAICFFDWKKQLSTASGDNMHDSTFKIVQSESWNGKSWIVLEETASKQNIFARYFIDPKTYYIWRTTVDQNKKRASDGQIQSLKINPKIDPSKFLVTKGA